MARKESMFLNGDAGDIGSDVSMDFSKHGDSMFEDVVANEKYIPERQGHITDKPDKRCHSSPHSAYRESLLQRDGTIDCKELAGSDTATTAKQESLVSVDVFSPSPHFTQGSLPARRRTWEKEIDKVTIYTDLGYNKNSDDEHHSPRLEVPVRDNLREPDRAPGSVASEDSFLYLLRKATRLGSFRPRLCKGVDVLDSTRTKTSKMDFRNKAKDEVNRLLFKSPVKQAHSSIDEPPRKSFPSRNNTSVTSFAELVRIKNQIRIPEKTILTSSAPEKKNKTFADKPVKEFRTLAEYFESKERNSPVLKLSSEPHSVAGAQPENRPPGAAALATGPQQVTRSPGNVALDVTYRKTMEVLAQLSTNRRADSTDVISTNQPEDEEYVISPVTQGEAKKMRSESKGNKQDVIAETGSPELTKPSPESSPVNMSLEEKKSADKEPLAGTISNSGRCGLVISILFATRISFSKQFCN